jgi:hypothetical protein
MRLFVLTMIVAGTLSGAEAAVAVTSTTHGTLAAHDGVLELFDRSARSLWRVDGVEHPGTLITQGNQAAVLDPMANRAVIVDLTSGKTTTMRTPETPIAGAFVNGKLVVLARDARVLTDGTKDVALTDDPALLRQVNGRLYVYSRVTGVVQEIDNMRATRRVTMPPFASDFEVDARNGYLVDPREGKIRTFSLDTMKPSETLDVGAVPVDLAFTGGGSALTARTLAVADPSAKRVWLVEGVQSMTQAITRGFLRGLLGLGLYGNRASQFPTGVDRVAVRGQTWVAYDSSTGTLYRFTNAKSTIVAKGVPPEGFTLGEHGIAYWQDGRLRLVR